jgi:dTDP-4-dehydrorhamnose 3,5-epimerase
MNVEKTELDGLLIVSPKVFHDDRGFFLETYNAQSYKAIGIAEDFVQDNMSCSKKGVIRGLHFQKDPHGQGKLVFVPRGKVLDITVDIRPESPTFGNYFAIELTEENKKQLYVPTGFAHGFVALTDDVIFQYKCTKNYNKASEAGIIWNDPDLAIDWGDGEKIISDKDTELSTWKEMKEFLGAK